MQSRPSDRSKVIAVCQNVSIFLSAFNRQDPQRFILALCFRQIGSVRDQSAATSRLRMASGLKGFPNFEARDLSRNVQPNKPAVVVITDHQLATVDQAEAIRKIQLSFATCRNHFSGEVKRANAMTLRVSEKHAFTERIDCDVNCARSPLELQLGSGHYLYTLGEPFLFDNENATHDPWHRVFKKPRLNLTIGRHRPVHVGRLLRKRQVGQSLAA
ncbi:hypothetical protein ASC76_10275 [Rhizobacter sp. Root404]|nr:hypothetical protein ASC76_10275 [Rhizobacter sp. Root404]